LCFVFGNVFFGNAVADRRAGRPTRSLTICLWKRHGTLVFDSNLTTITASYVRINRISRIAFWKRWKMKANRNKTFSLTIDLQGGFKNRRTYVAVIVVVFTKEFPYHSRKFKSTFHCFMAVKSFLTTPTLRIPNTKLLDLKAAHYITSFLKRCRRLPFFFFFFI